jgi:5-methylcytosine-specific restriction enzyme A
MPHAALRRCSTPACPGTPRPGHATCTACAAARDRTRGTFRQRGYSSTWDRRSASFLARHPRCVDCGDPAVVSDHAPRSRRELEAAGVTDPDADQYLQARCRRCDARRRVTVEHAFTTRARRV